MPDANACNPNGAMVLHDTTKIFPTSANGISGDCLRILDLIILAAPRTAGAVTGSCGPRASLNTRNAYNAPLGAVYPRWCKGSNHVAMVTKASSPVGGMLFANANWKNAPANRAMFVIAAMLAASFEKLAATISRQIPNERPVLSKDANVFERSRKSKVTSHKDGLFGGRFGGNSKKG